MSLASDLPPCELPKKKQGRLLEIEMDESDILIIRKKAPHPTNTKVWIQATELMRGERGTMYFRAHLRCQAEEMEGYDDERIM